MRDQPPSEVMNILAKLLGDSSRSEPSARGLMRGADDKVRDDTGLLDSDCRRQPMMSNASLLGPGP